MRIALVFLALLAACQPHERHASEADAAPSACAPPSTVTVKRAFFPGDDQGAVRLVTTLAASPDAAALAASLRPDSQDYAAVFDPDFAARMERWSASFWDALEKSHSTNLAGMTLAQPENATAREIILYSLPPSRLQHPGSALCGHAYTKSGVEKHFKPNVTVYCFGFRTIDQDDMRVSIVDALVFVREHWVVFPRPNDLPKAVAASCPPNVVGDPVPFVPREAPRASASPSGPEAARALLAHVLEQGAGARDAMAKLEPSLADVRALYKEPAATRLYEGMKPKWARFRKGGALLDDYDHVLPEPKDNIAYVYGASAAAIGSESSPFPVGYYRVLGDLLPNAYIYCYRFTEIGLAGGNVDGLAYVRGHWVLVPRPWETLGK